MRYDEDHWFGGIEIGSWPVWPTADDWLNRWEEVEDGEILLKLSGMKKRSIWNDLPYWKVGNQFAAEFIYRLNVKGVCELPSFL